MGLEVTYIIMEIEKCFDIRMEDDDLQRYIPFTVGSLVDIVKNKMEGEDSEKYIEKMVFGELVKGLKEISGKDIRIRPSAKIYTLGKDVMALLDKEWWSLSARIGYKLPPKSFNVVLGWIIFIMLILGAGFLQYTSHYYYLIMYVVSIYVIYKVLAIFFTRIPDITMRELVYSIIKMNYNTIKSKYGNAPERMIERIVIDIVAQELDMKPSKIKLDSRLVEDLGAG